MVLLETKVLVLNELRDLDIIYSETI